MEFNENELDNVVGGANPEVSEGIALSHDDLFRDKSIEDINKMRDEILRQDTGLAKDELTQEELDNVQAGRRF